MGDPKGFMKIGRKTAGYRPVCERVKDYKYVNIMRSGEESGEQAARCMDCGTPFCHWACPVGNYIPEWNDLIFEGCRDKAFELLDATNNLPEMTGRICPAPCEYSCVLGINDDPVTIRENELDAIEYAFEKGIIKPKPPGQRTGKKVAVVGSGPAGLSCAQQLNRAGHSVTVFEKDDKPGGLLRYGIPDFKLEKRIVERRLDLLRQEGIDFRTSVKVGRDYRSGDLLDDFDAVCLAIGSRTPRDLDIEGRALEGIHFAMDYLTQSNKRVSGEGPDEKESIDAAGKKVVVIGGGDTGSDCVGTANRQGASCVVQIEVMPRPEECRTDAYPWPSYPLILKTSSSHEEGSEREWSVLTKKFIGSGGKLTALECVRVEFEKTEGACPVMKEVPGSGFRLEADMALLAIGFVHPEHGGLVSDLGLELDERGNVKTDDSFRTSRDKVFSAGDMRRGQSLVVWAISEGRKAAYNIDRFLMGESALPSM
ncbi:MAG: glutamate synthase small subunit [Candidatus Omnitrophica bacterium]|nr:glutamate synthase small subunit [Candidatus Omnitrophota bacterium]